MKIMLGRHDMVTRAMVKSEVEISRLLYSYLVGNLQDPEFLLALERLVLGEFELELERRESIASFL